MIISKQRVILWLYILIVCAVLRGVFFLLNINAAFPIEESRLINVSSGSTFTNVVNNLAEQGLVSNSFDIRLYGRLSGKVSQIQAGEYELSPGMNSREFLQMLISGDVIFHQVVLLEGWTLSQSLEEIQAHPMVQSTLESGDKDELQALFQSPYYPEGLAFPDTYNFSRGTTDSEILIRAKNMMEETLVELWEARDAGLPYENSFEALIMASIIEKETGLASERQQISGVFIRRLQQGMRLQTDPTVIYGLGEAFDGNLTRDDLRAMTPYNTYRIDGLPPTPIALPGRESIFASLHPDQSDTLYFVAKGDGSHYFSSTLEEHEQAVEQYQLGNRQ
ncbi:MAG: endolytic transglycosylase MltG [Gammaproteobacteria bacterium]|nr:endolytic transglycosylase MltG [Gammaproteobacteria bacterium]